VISIKANQKLNQISLNAENTSLNIKSVSGSGVSFYHTDNLLTINLDNLYDSAEVFDITINYNHKNVKDSAFFVREGMVFTDCETSGARRWFPCNDVPDDKAQLELVARVPSNVLLASNGYLADSISSGDTTVYKWITDHQISTYLIAIVGSSNYNLDVINWKRPSGESMQVRFYWQNGETIFNLNNIKSKIGTMLDFYSEKFGDYPFEKLAFATTNRDFLWGGMENQTLVTLCPNCWTEDLATHELSHQWLGDLITPMTWSDIWLNEGFATFSEALWHEYKGGYKDYKANLLNEASKYLKYNPGWAIYQSSWNTITPDDNMIFNSAITYSKSSCVVYMLRYILGDQMFFDFLKLYAGNPDFMFGNISTEQFMDYINEVTETDLDWFFEQWLFRPNHPVYQNNYSIDAAGSDVWKVNYTLNQIQTNTGFYKMPVELKITFRSGKDTTLKVNNDYNLQTFEFEFDSEPARVSFDPNNNIILKEVVK
jgi:aminopeptidase N